MEPGLMLLDRIARILREWDAHQEEPRLRALLRTYTPQPDVPRADTFVPLCEAAQQVIIPQVQDFLTKKGLALLIHEIEGLPLMPVTEWFAGCSRPQEPVRGTVAVGEGNFANLHPYPAYEVPPTGLQTNGSVLTIVEYGLSPVDYALWYRVQNHFEGLIPAGWIPAPSLRFETGLGLIDLPFSDFNVG